MERKDTKEQRAKPVLQSLCVRSFWALVRGLESLGLSRIKAGEPPRRASRLQEKTEGPSLPLEGEGLGVGSNVLLGIGANVFLPSNGRGCDWGSFCKFFSH